MQEVILFYNGLGIPTRQILDSRGAIPSKIAANAKIAIQEMVEYSQKWHNRTSRSRSTKTSNGLASIQVLGLEAFLKLLLLRLELLLLMLLVYKLLLLVFRVNAAGTKLQLLKG
ncbi:hypothetical protein Tco_1322482 [Tanacetum coccineum]